MDAEQSGEVVKGLGSPQKETEIQKDVPKMESDGIETPAAATNGESAHGNGQSEGKAGAGDDAKTQEKVPHKQPVPVETTPSRGGTETKKDDETADEAKVAGDEEKSKEAKEEVKEKSDAVEAEVTSTEVTEQEDDPSPAPGSLAFNILEHDQTKDSFATARTLVVLRGLPGSGKTFLARAIAESYKDLCSVVCADDHGAQPSSADGYEAFDEAIAATCGTDTSPALVVVDDSNHSQDRLAHLGRIAKQNKLVVVFLEPRTEWSRDTTQLIRKTKRGVEQAKLEVMKKAHEEMSIPLYFGWFLFFTVQDKVRETSMNFLKALKVLESFKKHISDFSGKEEEQEVDLEQYFKAKGTLHCTAKFTDYGKAEGAKEYVEKQVVQDLYGSVSELSLSALFVTPRTVGARVSLSEDQLRLWPLDGEKEAESVVPGAATLPQGSRAHITLGCADGVQPVQTGFDLLQILLLQKDGQQGEQEEIEPGTLAYYGEGRWYLALKEPITAAACFSSTYKPKAPGPAKKEKKKPKCAIL